MNPWLVFWAPQLHLPFGGDVAQRIQPSTNWFFDGIGPTSGDSVIERKAFEVASYGRQLGLITEILMDVATKTPPSTSKGKESLKRLKEIQSRIETLKEGDASELVDAVEALVARLKRSHKDELPRLRQQIERALADSGA